MPIEVVQQLARIDKGLSNTDRIVSPGEKARDAYYEECRRDLAVWCREALKPFKQTPDAPLHRKLIFQLERVARGEIDRLMVFMPPRYGKSWYTSILFPPWYLAQDPTKSIIATSHTDRLAQRFGRAVRNIVHQYSGLLQYSLAADLQAKGEWATSRGGEYKAAGVGQGIAGRPANLIIIDDPIKDRQDAESQVVRDHVWDWYQGDVYPRLEPDGKIILIHTRWHQDDLAGRLLNEMALGKDQWEVIKFPALASANDDPLGRNADEPLWPERYSKEAILRIRANIAPRDWWSEYQQEPRPPGGAFFQQESFLVDGRAVEMPNRPDSIFGVLDTAIKTGSKNDGTGMTFFAKTKGGRMTPLIVLDWSIEQITGASLELWLPQMMNRGEELARQVNARMGFIGVWAEDKGSGTILLQQAQRRNQLVAEGRLHGERPWLVYPIESALTGMGKDERGLNASSYVHRGDVKIAAPAYEKTMVYKGRMANHFLTQVFGFQLGVKDQDDDLYDTLVYGVAIGLGGSEGF